MSFQRRLSAFVFFFFNDTATTEIYTRFPTRRSSDLFSEACLEGLIDQLRARLGDAGHHAIQLPCQDADLIGDRKSTRLNSSHGYISHAVFCLRNKKTPPLSHSTHRCSEDGRLTYLLS